MEKLPSRSASHLVLLVHRSIVDEVMAELEDSCSFPTTVDTEAARDENCVDVSYQDADDLVAIWAVVRDHSEVVIGLLLFLLGRGRIVEIKHGDVSVKARGFSLHAIKKLFQNLMTTDTAPKQKQPRGRRRSARSRPRDK